MIMTGLLCEHFRSVRRRNEETGRKVDPTAFEPREFTRSERISGFGDVSDLPQMSHEAPFILWVEVANWKGREEGRRVTILPNLSRDESICEESGFFGLVVKNSDFSHCTPCRLNKEYALPSPNNRLLILLSPFN